MICCPQVRKSQIRQHYDWATPFYRLLWGEHIHHGLWTGQESPVVAQRQLVTELAELARITPGSLVLDVGCGMGGSSMHLAREFGCAVTGVTLSPVQRWWANTWARARGLGRQLTVMCDDVEQTDFSDASFDVVWSIECTEHLYDKASFFARAARWLRPGGKLAICAWLAGGDSLDVGRTAQVERVCEAFLCPSLGSAADYERWMSDAGLRAVARKDWTNRVMRTWEICQRRVERSRVRLLARVVPGMVLFLDSFDAIYTAYASGAMAYGCFVFEKPSRSAQAATNGAAK
ncbi:MAG TPA: class I SAM-dependent methyltransferase [Pirellulales bacterium]|nr:class I SAM-dependent methyltransferase [Pirellulales bacterium]